ncbi:MAG: ribonuclease HII, partial [Candidatus Nitrotoga sp.]
MKNNLFICGVDEAGRGPLAGPVYAAAVILDSSRPIEGLDDSKKLSEKRRDYLALEIKQHAVAWAIAEASVKEIDSINILRASLLAMRRAIEMLQIRPHEILVDGLYCPDTGIPSRAIVRGDSTVTSISAASILAKTARDAAMLLL